MNKLYKIARKITASYEYYISDIYIPADDIEFDKFQINGKDMLQGGDKIFLSGGIIFDADVCPDQYCIDDVFNVHFEDKKNLFWSEKNNDYLQVKDDDKLYINGNFINSFNGTKKQFVQNINRYFELPENFDVEKIIKEAQESDEIGHYDGYTWFGD